jgi:hypothetical protein
MNKEKSDCELVHNSLHALQENHSSDDDSMACYGVNLAFLREFIKLNQIPSNMTTAEVVEQSLSHKHRNHSQHFSQQSYQRRSFGRIFGLVDERSKGKNV